jgi:ectoine hydroxylase-related dioxygenase (phytanoyl-CoA dioxygenase family)
MYLDERHKFNVVNKIMPKQGRILLFDGRTYHSASSPTTGMRCIITLDLFGEFEDGSYKFPAPKQEKKNNLKYQ